MAVAGSLFCVALLVFGLPYSGRLRVFVSHPQNNSAATAARELFLWVVGAACAAAFFWAMAVAAMVVFYVGG
jgi:fatty acid desaturase